MIGLGILAAGAAQGAANASNMNVQAQNQLELDQSREALREEYLNKRFDKELTIGREKAKAEGILRAQQYERDRTNKLTDAEAAHTRQLEIEDRRDGRSAASNATRLRAAAMRNKAGGEGGDNGKSITLPNGEVFTPNSPEYRLAADMVRTGDAPNINEAVRIVIARSLAGNAAGSMKGLTEGIVPTARNMSGELFQQKQRFKLEDLIK